LLPDFYKNGKFEDNLTENYNEEAGNCSVCFKFLKESYALKQLQESNMFFDWENNHNLDTYTASIDITRYEAFNEVYWKVNISNIRLQTTTNTFTTF